LIFITLAFVLMASALFAQRVHRASAIATPDGVFVYLGKHIPKEHYYELESKNQRGGYKPIATIRAPADRAEMEARVKMFSPHFPLLRALTNEEVDKIWRYFSHNSTADSAHTANLPLVHLIMGTGYLDRSVARGSERQYRVRLLDANGREVSVEESNVAKMPATPDISKPILRDVEASGGEIRLEWSVREKGDLSSYHIYRSVFGKNEYAPAPAIKGYNTRDGEVMLIAIDTAASTPGHYEYFIVPVDAYGNPGPSSDTVSAGTLDGPNPPLIERLTAEGSGKEHEIVVSWKMSAGRYLRGIEIYRSVAYDSGFSRIAVVPPSDTVFIDHVPVSSENFYYQIVVRGPGKRTASSAVVSTLYRDSQPPSPPVEIATETIDGGVRVHWMYDEPFVKGFFVERADRPDSEYRLVSPLIPFDSTLLSFTDTTSAVRSYEAAFYRIVAVSDSDVHSEPSKPVNGTPGVSTLPEVPPRPEVRWEDGKVLVEWSDLREVDPDLLGYVLWRKEARGVFDVIYESRDGSAKNYFVDTNVQPGFSYSYAIQALDIDGETSALSDSTSIVVPALGPAPPSFVRLLSADNGIHISWGRVMSADLRSLRLYRQEPGSEAVLVAELDKDQLDHVDTSVQRGSLYSYFLTSVDVRGIEGERGELSTIRY
jgi:fibronectin type 3 domain-containing protein